MYKTKKFLKIIFSLVLWSYFFSTFLLNAAENLSLEDNDNLNIRNESSLSAATQEEFADREPIISVRDTSDRAATNLANIIRVDHGHIEIEDDKFINTILFSGEMVTEDRRLSYMDNLFKCIAVFFGSTAGVPICILAKNASGSNEVLGWVFAGTTLLNVGASRTWGLLHVIPDMATISSKIRSSEEKCSVFDIAKYFACHITGLLSSLPYSYAVYQHNTIKILAVPTFVSEYGLGAYGYIEFMKKKSLSGSLRYLIRTCNPRQHNALEETNDKEKTRDKLILALSNFVSNILTLECTSRREMIDRLHHNISYGHNLEEFLDAILSIDRKHDLGFHAYGKFFSKNASYIIPLSNAFLNVVFSVNAAKVISDSIFFIVAYSLVAVTPGLVLGTIINGETFEDMYSNIFSLKGKSFYYGYYPKTRMFSIAFSLITAALTASGSIFLTYDTIRQSILHDYTMYFTIMNGIGAVIFEYYAMIYILENINTLYAKKYGNAEEKKLLHIKKKTDMLAMALASVGSQKIDSYFARIKDQDTELVRKNGVELTSS